MSAPVCRYFLTNCCRFGDRCRFSHQLGGSGSSTKNPYVYVKDKDGEPNPNRWKQNLSSTDTFEVIERIAEEAKQIQHGNMWPLTCLSVLKDVPNVPGWEDFSMEELRVAAYASKDSGRFQNYVQFYNEIKQKAEANRLIFLRPGKRTEEIVRGMFNTPRSSAPINSKHSPENNSSNFSFNSSQIPAFAGASTPHTSPTPFGSSFRGGGYTPLGASTPYIPGNGMTKDPAPGIFGMAAKGITPPQFSSGGFQGNVGLPNDSVMETAQSTFNQPASFNQNIFGQVVQPIGQTVFGHPGAPSGFRPSLGMIPSNPFFETPSSDIQTTNNNPASLNAIFTPIDLLTPDEIEQFKALTFTFDKLPLRPPPPEYC